MTSYRLALSLVALCGCASLGPSLLAQGANSGLNVKLLAPATDTVAVTVETEGRTIPFATAFQTVRRVPRRGRAAIELTYQWHGNDGSATADTLWVNAADLAPIENHRHNGLQDAVTLFERSGAHTRYTTKGKGQQQADTTVAGRLYASGELEELIRLSPLAPGYFGSYTLYYGPPGQLARRAEFHVARSETLLGRDGTRADCWVVDAPLSEGLNTFYVRKSDRRVVRLVNHEDTSAAFVFTK